MRQYRICLFLSFVFIVGSCSEKSFDTPLPTEPSEIIVSDNNLEFDSNANQYTFMVNTNCDYDVVIPVDWISHIKTKATHTDSITLVIAANNTYYSRKCDVIILAQDSTVSDTIHIFQYEGFESIRKIIKKDDKCSIFYKALQLTGLGDSIIAYIDYSYPSVQYDSTLAYILETGDRPHYIKVAYEKDFIVWPEKREFKYTLFVEPDDVYNANGITTIDELRRKAELWYPEHPELFDDLTNRNNSLNKFISYHILPCYLTYDQLNISSPEIVKNLMAVSDWDGFWQSSPYIHDVEDFYETLLPHSVLRISTPGESPFYHVRGSIFINRKGAEYQISESEINRFQQRYGYTIHPPKLDYRGIKISEPSEYSPSINNGVNGIYHYIDDLLLYDMITRNEVLNCRMRVMNSTISPDFINSGARGRLLEDRRNSFVYSFKQGYCKNVLWSDGTLFYVRYLSPDFPYLMGDAMIIWGDYDVAFKIPPVPTDGLYELRFNNYSIPRDNPHGYNGIVQFYLHQYESSEKMANWNEWNWIAQGEPVDFSIVGDDSSIGMILDNSDEFSGLSMIERYNATTANDSLMRQNGYMKAPDTYVNNPSTSPRDNKFCYRKIICKEYLQADKDYYIRIKKVDNSHDTFCYFNCLEIVPESIYSGINGREDPH